MIVLNFQQMDVILGSQIKTPLTCALVFTTNVLTHEVLVYGLKWEQIHVILHFCTVFLINAGGNKLGLQLTIVFNIN